MLIPGRDRKGYCELDSEIAEIENSNQDYGAAKGGLVPGESHVSPSHFSPGA
jgi:hypothetical protein